MKELAQKQWEVGEMSRQLGERAAKEWVEQKYPQAKLLYGGPNAKSNMGDFDQVWEVVNAKGEKEVLVIECKGGNSGLGTAQVRGKIREQGTSEYFNRTQGLMADKSRAAFGAIRSAGKKVKYMLIEAKIDSTGLMPKPIKVSEFDLSGNDAWK